MYIRGFFSPKNARWLKNLARIARDIVQLFGDGFNADQAVVSTADPGGKLE
jgi:hypothetical protein